MYKSAIAVLVGVLGLTVIRRIGMLPVADDIGLTMRAVNDTAGYLIENCQAVISDGV